MSKKLKRYAVTTDLADESKGYQRVSLVAKPAIERGWVALAAAAPTTARRVHLSSEPQRQVLTGPVLVPDLDIYRNEPEPHNIFFSAEEIEKISRKLMAEGRTTDTNQDHDVELAGNVVQELWIVENPTVDKAAALGLEVPKGTLMMSLYVPDTDYWEKEIVTGNKTGFSIEGLFDFSEVKLAAQTPNQSNMFKTLWAMLSAAAKNANIKLAQVQLNDERIVDVAEDGTVTLLTDTGEKGEALPDGSYELKDGGTLQVEGGKKKPEAPADSEKKVENADEGKKEEKQDDTLKAAQDALAGVAEETDPAKLTAKLKAALKALGVTELAATNVKLEAIPMADGSTFNLNPLTRLLTDSENKPVTTGAYACADGSYVKVNLDQYTYCIDKETYERSLQLSAVEKELAEAKLQLSSQSGGKRITLAGETTQVEDLTPAQRRLQLAKATR